MHSRKTMLSQAETTLTEAQASIISSRTTAFSRNDSGEGLT